MLAFGAAEAAPPIRREKTFLRDERVRRQGASEVDG
jgi:hypothetical protein